MTTMKRISGAVTSQTQPDSPVLPRLVIMVGLMSLVQLCQMSQQRKIAQGRRSMTQLVQL